MTDQHENQIATLTAELAQLSEQRRAVLALHVSDPDSIYCLCDDEHWPCATRYALGASK